MKIVELFLKWLDFKGLLDEREKNSWRLHTYSTVAMSAQPMAYNVNHYLLFERETWLDFPSSFHFCVSIKTTRSKVALTWHWLDYCEKKQIDDFS